MSEWPGVFISSTCFDLIDLRAELEAHIRDLRLVPSLSDAPGSAFDVAAGTNSIEACLANVSKCPTFICILNQRYGPTLEKYGYPDISATHLEYRTAYDAGKRILVYVRDRAVGDYGVWRKASAAGGGIPKLPWIQEKDYGLFKLLDEHTQPRANNWYWTFASSVDLKERVSLDLRGAIAHTRLQHALETDRLPLIVLKAIQSSRSEKSVAVVLECHLTGDPVVDFEIEVEGAARQWFHYLGPDKAEQAGLSFVPAAGPDKQTELPIFLRYTTRSGMRVQETRSITVPSFVVSNSRTLKLLDDTPVRVE
jgi:hypothetical protein